VLSGSNVMEVTIVRRLGDARITGIIPKVPLTDLGDDRTDATSGTVRRCAAQ